jgi:hypothetical protein
VGAVVAALLWFSGPYLSLTAFFPTNKIQLAAAGGTGAGWISGPDIVAGEADDGEGGRDLTPSTRSL